MEEEIEWLLDVINEDGTSHVCDERFATDQVVVDAIDATIDEEGIEVFLD